MSYPGVALSVCKLHFYSLIEYRWIFTGDTWANSWVWDSAQNMEGVPAGEIMELLCWSLSIWKNIIEGHFWKSGLFWVLLTCVRRYRGDQSYETEVFWVRIKQISGWFFSDLAHAFSSVLVSLEGLSAAQSQHKVLGSVIVREFPLHGPCFKPIAWLLFAKVLNCPKRSHGCAGSRHSSIQGCNSSIG